MKPYRLIVAIVFILTLAAFVVSPMGAEGTAVQATGDICASIQEALKLTQEACAATGRNQACYGNITLSAEAQPGASLSFQQQGDLADVEAIRSLQLSSQAEDRQWGIAWLQLQANLPDDDPAQNLTLLLFGQVRIENGVEPFVEPETVEISASGSANVRGEPSTKGAIVGKLTGGQTVIADGRLEDGSWLHVRLDEEETGWVFGELVQSEGDVSTLAVVDETWAGTENQRYGPMQAFKLATGAADAPCEAAPDSGLLVQTPEGAAQVTLRVNEVDIKLRSTAYLQAQASGEMVVNLVEGSGQVEAVGKAVNVPAGTRVRVPLDANLAASGQPSDPEPYDPAPLAALPITVLSRPIEIAEPNEGGGAILVQTGTWTQRLDTENPLFNDCGLSMETYVPPPFEISTPDMFEFAMRLLEDGRKYSPEASFEVTNPEVNVYVLTSIYKTFTDIREYRVISPELMEASITSIEPDCTAFIPWIWNMLAES